jgi:predicted nucleic acid-binding protein
MGKITSVLNRLAGQRVYVDTNLFIYFLAQNPEFYAVSSGILEAIEQGRFIGYTGNITISETLVKPYKTDDFLLVAQIKAFFSAEDFLVIQNHDLATFDLCAQIRAKQGMKFADALHYATALKSGCTFFITNDLGIRSSNGIEVILLKDCIE